jgi:peptidoglycan/xylan/chitin deacetylase (PgdA/CDA1 family)
LNAENRARRVVRRLARATVTALAGASAVALSAASFPVWTSGVFEPAPSSPCVHRHGAIVRGPADRPRLAIVFTGHEFAEGGDHILDVLARQGANVSFFVTGDFARQPAFGPLLRRIVREGHGLGPHSDRHLLYAAWEPPHASLVSREELRRDLQDNVVALAPFAGADGTVPPPVRAGGRRYWIPSYEWFNAETVEWAGELGFHTVTFTPGTRANADYTGEADRNFVTSERIVASIRERAAHAEGGLNGFVLLMHIGAGAGRTDKLHLRLEEILDILRERGYQVVPLAELLADCG